MEKNGNPEYQYENGNGDFATSTSSTQTTQIDGLTEFNQRSEDVGDAFGSSFFPSASQNLLGISLTDKDAWFYNMNHKHRGKAIIFNHENFEVGNLESRNGTAMDCIHLEKELRNLGFDVTLYKDLTLNEMDIKLDYLSEEVDYSDHDCLLMVVLSHGNKGIIYAKDGPYKPEDELWGRFTGDKCLSLANKPKLFFIQACQGFRYDKGISMRTQVDGDESTFKIPIHADFLIAYSTIPGYFSWRSNVKGSWFMQALCEIFNKYGDKLDLLTMLTHVNRKVAIDFESNVPNDTLKHQKKQIPCITSMLTRLVKFDKKK